MKKRFDVHNVHITTLSKQSSKFSVNKRRKNIVLVLLFGISISSSVYALSAFSHLGSINISKVSIEGADEDIRSSLETGALGAIKGDYLGLFSRSNFFLFSKASISDALVSISPRIDTLSISRDGLSSIKISINEKSPSAIVCAGLPILNDSGSEEEVNTEKCYFTDAFGVLYREAGTFSPNMYNNYYIPDGDMKLASSTFSALQKFYDILRKNEVEPLGILIKGGGEYEIYINNPARNSKTVSTSTDNETIVVYFNDINGFENELSNFISFWSHMLGEARTKKEYLNFETIDLRYGSNVFYRLTK